jgi:diacylglycerol kinase (ATP)
MPCTPRPVPHVVLNPNARQLRRHPGLLRELTQLTRGRGQVWVTRDLGELEMVARRIAAVPGDRVALCGGDGTFMAGVTALARAGGGRVPPLALIPAGTVATVARQWGAAGELTATVDRFLRLGATPPADEHATLRIVADGVVRYGFTFGTGLVARFFERYEAGGSGGLPAAAVIFGRVFLGSFVDDPYSRAILDPIGCRLLVEQRPLEPRAYSLIVSSVLRSVGLGLRVTHRASEDLERPHLVASSLPARRLGPQALRVCRGRGLTGPGGVDALVRSFAVRFPTDQPGPYVFDGDLFQARQIQVSAGPRIAVVRVPCP